MFLHKNLKRVFFTALFLFVLFFSSTAKADNNYIDFIVDRNYDSLGRDRVTATLVKTTSSVYFYVEKGWWEQQTQQKRDEILTNLDNLSLEFNRNIYPTLTSAFGQEWRPGVDGDEHLTILFEALKEGSAGYFRTADEYIKLQLPSSNEREMIYINLSSIDSPQLKTLVAHEFTHVIEFNQKDKINGVQEEVWLNEARADYTSTLLGYDDAYEGSNLQKRVRDFLQNPSDSLTEWQEQKYDYAVTSLFTHYLVDHYSITILGNSLKSKLVGIASINEALLKAGVKEDFSSIFTNWIVASLINDCSLDLKYCYLNPNLRNVKISPTLNFLPITGSSSLSVTNLTKNWSGNWQKFIGGSGSLTLNFSSLAGINFQVPYLIVNKDNSYALSLLPLTKDNNGQISITNFGLKNTSLVLMPSLRTKTADFSSQEPTYPYTLTVSIQDGSFNPPPPSPTPPPPPSSNLCQQIVRNLSVGMSGSDVKCLQQFLKNQGSSIYPEGLVTGYFGPLTRIAIIRFQEKYWADILRLAQLNAGTGFVGPLTRSKINQLLSHE